MEEKTAEVLLQLIGVGVVLFVLMAIVDCVFGDGPRERSKHQRPGKKDA